MKKTNSGTSPRFPRGSAPSKKGSPMKGGPSGTAGKKGESSAPMRGTGKSSKSKPSKGC